ncbi:hypothetical protein FNV43_RR02413 [Rhamnella rubrinervis]|uniref:J domain-containing protein n=1 Tax=Rhamnella rubrinervis TaxID=2594499 RepID=A0A8K0HTP5_9ROSA|nr:hypothetical protein FNV43_RR02413 [Rhamnella rubrinervis]
MDMDVDHYSVLGLPSGEEGAELTEIEISRAYKAKALELHPDKRPHDPDAHSNFQKLKSSYDILKDEKARKLFDHLLKIILTAHARQGIPTAIKMALLNSTFLKYEHAIIGTDPNLPNMLKLQIQMTGAEEVATAYAGTLHYQVVYWLQNHALNLPGPSLQGLPLQITTERDDIASIIHTPKQIAPEASLHQKLLHQGVFHTLMITPAFRQCSLDLEKDIPIAEFNTDGSLNFVSHINGHFICDIDPSMCYPGYDCPSDEVAQLYTHPSQRISVLDKELMDIINHRTTSSSAFADKEAEIRRRKKQLKEIDDDLDRKPSKLVQQFQVLPSDDDAVLESLFSEQEQEDEQTTLVIRSSQSYYSDSEDTDDSYALKINPADESLAPIMQTIRIPSPNVSIQVLRSELLEKDILIGMDVYA